MERRKFTREFKLEAVRLIKGRGVSYVRAAQDLGVHVSQLRDWVRRFSDDPQHAFPGHGQMTKFPPRDKMESSGIVIAVVLFMSARVGLVLGPKTTANQPFEDSITLTSL